VTVVDGLPEAPANAFAEGELVRVSNVRAPAHALAGGLV
jgi:hypothetical protein